MNVLIAGGGSTVGRALVTRLRGEGHTLDVLSRSGPLPGDVTRPETLAGCCNGRDAVVSLVGASLDPTPRFPEQTFEDVDRDGNLALLAEAERAGVPRFIYLSVFGDYPPGLAYVDAHRAVEAALEASAISSTVIRPTGFFGSFDALRAGAKWGLGVRVGSGEAKTNPIHEADLAEVIADHVFAGPAVVECGGPEVLTRNEIARRLGPGTVRLLPVPASLMGLASTLTRPASKRIRDLIVFLRHVLTHDAIAPRFGNRTLGGPP